MLIINHAVGKQSYCHHDLASFGLIPRDRSFNYNLDHEMHSKAKA